MRKCKPFGKSMTKLAALAKQAKKKKTAAARKQLVAQIKRLLSGQTDACINPKYH